MVRYVLHSGLTERAHPRVDLSLVPIRQSRKSVCALRGAPGPEIWRDCPDVTHFVAVSRHEWHVVRRGQVFEGKESGHQRYGPSNCPAGEMVDGLRNLDDGYIFRPSSLDLGGEKLLDRKTVVGPRDSIIWTRRLTDVGAIFAGLSTGAVMAGAVSNCAAQYRGGDDRHHLARWRMEVPLHWRMDGGHRRGRRASKEDRLLLRVFDHGAVRSPRAWNAIGRPPDRRLRQRLWRT